ncbi:MAG: hypothetical protein ACTHKZ_08445, partial [Lysobacteraceae bacterium]
MTPPNDTAVHSPTELFRPFAPEGAAGATAQHVAQATRHALTHLDRLEAESLHILREVAAGFRNPVMLYSVGKDSSVLLHLLVKAF